MIGHSNKPHARARAASRQRSVSSLPQRISIHALSSCYRVILTQPRCRNLDFARNLYQILSSDPRDAPATDALVEQAKKFIDTLHTGQQAKYLPGISGDPEIDKQATRLWNICTRLKREHYGDSAEDKRKSKRLRKLFLHGRVLAFNLLVLVRARVLEKGGRVADVVYLLKLALKAARDCIGMRLGIRSLGDATLT